LFFVWVLVIVKEDTPLTITSTHTKNSYPLYGKTYG
jgi:hypothetical protein